MISCSENAKTRETNVYINCKGSYWEYTWPVSCISRRFCFHFFQNNNVSYRNATLYAKYIHTNPVQNASIEYCMFLVTFSCFQNILFGLSSTLNPPSFCVCKHKSTVWYFTRAFVMSYFHICVCVWAKNFPKIDEIQCFGSKNENEEHAFKNRTIILLEQFPTLILYL